MKPSHISTPRMLNDACFIPSGAALERPAPGYGGLWWACIVVVAVIGAAVIVATR